MKGLNQNYNMKFCFGFPHRMGLYVTAIMTAVQGLILVYMSIPLLEGFSLQCTFKTSAAQNYYLTFLDSHDTPNLDFITEDSLVNDEKLYLYYFLALTQSFLGFFFVPVICLIILAMCFLTSAIIWQNITLIVEYLVLEMVIIIYMYLGTINGLARGYWVFVFAFIFITFMVYLWSIVFIYVQLFIEQQKTKVYFRTMNIRSVDIRPRWARCNVVRY